MNEEQNILGCYVSSMKGDNNGELFRNYIWGENGICGTLKQLKVGDYGKDVIMILFQFYVNPIPYPQQNLKEVGSYRTNEKSISVTIIVNNENFFSKSEDERRRFLKQSILHKVDIFTELVTKQKMDTRMDMLKADLQKILS